MNEYDCLVIGAGMSGLMAAGKLSDRGLHVFVADKGRKVGGRMATRISGRLRFDHGAQIIRATGAAFALSVENWRKAGILKICDYPSPETSRNEDGKKYCVPAGFAELPRFLADGLNVRTGCRVMRLTRESDRWLAETADGDSYSARAVIMTPPVPQSLDLLKSGGTVLPEEIADRLRRVRYEPCLTLMLRGEVSKRLAAAPFVRPGGETVSLLVNNYAKGVSPEPGTVTVHTTGTFSEDHWSDDDDSIIDRLFDECREYFRYSDGYLRVHRWRYSRIVTASPKPCEIMESPGLLALAGDAFSGRDIEGACLSGLAAAEAIIHRLASN